MNILKILTAIGCALLVAAACSSTSGSGSNSNWVTCATNDDCRSLGSSWTCSNRKCVSSSGPAQDGGGAQCGDRSALAQRRIQALLGGADKHCSIDSDCTMAPAVTCAGTCGLPFVSKVGVQNIASGIAAVESDVCDPFHAAGCKDPVTFCPSIGVPKCVNQRCENSLGPLPEGGTIAGPTCDDRLNQISAAVDDAVSKTDQTCKVSSDCVVVGTTLQCRDTCGWVVASNAGAAALGAALANLEPRVCDPFYAAGCTSPPPPPCVPPPPDSAALCAQGKCNVGVQ